jgi:SprB repeat/Secretion system C-terminal sorting domain/CARDB
MKKIFTFAFALGLTVASYAQVQRMVLSEEFTNASCGPCASQNPAYNTLMAANTSKVITLKYQTVWPGVDPMNAQNQTDVATRVTYYGVNGVPYAPMDGDTNITSATAYNGAPAAYNQAMIDAQYAAPAHWTINLTHHLSLDLDSIYITCVVTPDATNPSIAGLKLHIALIEKEINFLAPPGTNGETDFYNVMRKMYPSAAGQNLDASNATGAFTYTVAKALPTYLYDLNQVGVVAFIQNNTHIGTAWPVQQAAMSQPQPLSVDGALTNSTAVTGAYFCGTSFTPTVTLKNPGATALTTAVISYTLDNGTPSFFNYTGNLATGATAVVTLPAVTVGGGTHTFAAKIDSINGVSDINIGNNTQSKTFTNYSGGSPAIGYSNNFTVNPLTAGTYSVVNPDAAATWTYSSTVGSGAPAGSMRMNFWQSSTIGEVDELILPPYSTVGAINGKIKFKHAASQYEDATTPATNDQIDLMFSTDCGTTWTSIWTKAGAELATNGVPSSTLFVPTAAQWVSDEVIFPAAALNQSSLLIKFMATSDFGNMAYLDNINITSNNVSLASENISCNGAANGTATVTPLVGTAPYSYLWSNGATTATAANLAPGNYTCIISDNSGVLDTTDVVITQPTAISATGTTVANSNATSPNGSATAVVSGGVAPYTYLWSNTGHAVSSTMTGVTSGTYTCLITDANGCTFTWTSVIASTVGVVDLYNNNSLSIYPNPFADNTTLKLNLSKSENVSYTLVTPIGQVVGFENKGKLQAGESLISIDGSNLAAGIYLMNVTVGSKTYSQKLNVVK